MNLFFFKKKNKRKKKRCTRIYSLGSFYQTNPKFFFSYISHALELTKLEQALTDPLSLCCGSQTKFKFGSPMALSTIFARWLHEWI